MIGFLRKSHERLMQARIDQSAGAIEKFAADISRLETRLQNLEVALLEIQQRLPPPNLAGDQLNTRFAMADARLTHLERVAGLDDSRADDEPANMASFLDNRLRSMEMRLMSYLEGPYLARARSQAVHDQRAAGPSKGAEGGLTSQD